MLGVFAVVVDDDEGSCALSFGDVGYLLDVRSLVGVVRGFANAEEVID